ncbi:Chemotaxis protein methyltransferase [Zhongshania aliphaticivorans]|uniref:Chemotaxis protein methyltransferase n=1 Tax=Zhongshania aliphaticivorans TaxID=1470434 RepID=A0A5S9NMX5_9GAMM|nr:CheR family methyltransferase [Zhongshania aliphaticivorans]CAA0091193.1 Chemotaxis protein methyltransferase [Zhongshania aliphaticivorans]CAA0098655.1 Chemotaxis protein methyltransferase [Zhongshania aliphaticivorans]
MRTELVSQKFEFSFNESHFDKIRELVFSHTGISLGDEKRQLAYSRYSKRLRALGIDDFDDYIDIVRSGNESEIPLFVSAITTNFTSFFRENHHFDFLVNEVRRLLLTQNSIRIWSAGCSSGEEPYSIAMALLSGVPGVESADVKILATDLDSEILDRAFRGVYPKEKIEGVDQNMVKSWIKHGSNDNKGYVMVHPKVRGMVSFKQLNLLESWPIKNSFDIIFCRNVVIYFCKEVQKTLFSKFANNQKKGSQLMIGHSENLAGVCDSYRLIGRTIYEKI